MLILTRVQIRHLFPPGWLVGDAGSADTNPRAAREIDNDLLTDGMNLSCL